jgi:hypothetical protein
MCDPLAGTERDTCPVALPTARRHASPVVQPLSTDLDDPDARPYFVWDEHITMRELRQKLASPVVEERALWMARVLREARYQDVWQLLRLSEVLAMWPLLDRHLGRTREFWNWLIEGWRSDGLIPRS